MFSNCYSQLIVLSENRQLQLLHRKIVAVNQQYLQRKREWLKVKYKLIEMNNLFASELGIICGDNTIKKEQLKMAIKIEDSHNNQVNQQFSYLFQKQYLEKILTELNPIISTSNLFQSQQPQSQHGKNVLKSSPILLIDNIQNNISKEQIQLQLVSQKHCNQLLYKEIEILEKQYDCLSKHAKEKLKKQQEQSQQQQNQQQLQQQYLLYMNHPNISPPTQQQPPIISQQIHLNNQYFQSQISCVLKLISNKLSVISELKQSNSIMKKKLTELKARQYYLEKRKDMMQAKHHQLQKRRTQIMEEYTQNNSKYQATMNQQSNGIISVHNKNSIINNSQTIQSVSEINQLITKQLAHQLNQQKLLLVRQKLK